jgi:hypothetical protein
VQRDEMLELQDQEMPYAYTEDSWLPLGADDDDGWEDMPTALPTGVHTFPPGEEAVLQSHAGGEAIMHQMMEGLQPGCVPLSFHTPPC